MHCISHRLFKAVENNTNCIDYPTETEIEWKRCDIFQAVQNHERAMTINVHGRLKSQNQSMSSDKLGTSRVYAFLKNLLRFISCLFLRPNKSFLFC